MKIKIGSVEYEFKHINIPEDHTFDENHLNFLKTLDEALVKSRENISNKEDVEKIKADLEVTLKEMKSEFNYEKMQEQINAIFIKLNDFSVGNVVMSKEEKERKERNLNAEWVRGLVKKDKVRMQAAEKELKTLEPIMHLGPATGSGSSDLGEDYTQGGYLVPELLLAEVNRFVTEGGVARREFRYLPFAGAGNARYIPTLLTNVTVDWIDEGEKKPKTKPYISRVQQTLKKLAAMVIFTEEIIEDTVIDLTSFSAQLIGEAIAAEEDNQFFAGTGAPWTGILTTAGVVDLTLAATVGPLNMRPEALMAMTVAVPTDGLAGAKFYMHRQVWAAISARRSDSIAAGDSRGVYLVQEPSQSSPGSIWGYPVVLVESMPSIADLYGVTDMTDIDPDLTVESDEPFIIFGNLKKCVAYGDKQGLRVKLLDQASVYDDNDTLVNLAEQDMIAIRIHKRVGYVVILPAGICVLNTGPTS